MGGESGRKKGVVARETGSGARKRQEIGRKSGDWVFHSFSIDICTHHIHTASFKLSF